MPRLVVGERGSAGRAYLSSTSDTPNSVMMDRNDTLNTDDSVERLKLHVALITSVSTRNSAIEMYLAPVRGSLLCSTLGTTLSSQSASSSPQNARRCR